MYHPRSLTPKAIQLTITAKVTELKHQLEGTVQTITII